MSDDIQQQLAERKRREQEKHDQTINQQQSTQSEAQQISNNNNNNNSMNNNSNIDNLVFPNDETVDAVSNLMRRIERRKGRIRELQNEAENIRKQIQSESIELANEESLLRRVMNQSQSPRHPSQQQQNIQQNEEKNETQSQDEQKQSSKSPQTQDSKENNNNNNNKSTQSIDSIQEQKEKERQEALDREVALQLQRQIEREESNNDDNNINISNINNNNNGFEQLFGTTSLNEPFFRSISYQSGPNGTSRIVYSSSSNSFNVNNNNNSSNSNNNNNNNNNGDISSDDEDPFAVFSNQFGTSIFNRQGSSNIFRDNTFNIFERLQNDNSNGNNNNNNNNNNNINIRQRQLGQIPFGLLTGMPFGMFGNHGLDADIDNMDYDQLLRMFPNVPRGAREQDIQALPTDKYKEQPTQTTESKDNNNNNTNNNNNNKDKCSICLEEFKNGDEIRRLPCLHIFHKDEIDHWLRTNHICPICRGPIDEQRNNNNNQNE